MKITVIHGNARKSSTWNCTKLFLKELEKYDSTAVTEFTMPTDMPHFCHGCFSCMMSGERTCPHAAQVQPIAEALADADLILLTSPVYALDISGQMKTLLDHLCYQWLSHRPNPAMFGKVGVTIVTTAGAGLGHTSKTLKNSLRFWGVKRIFFIRNAVSAARWGEVSEEKKAKIHQNIKKTAKQTVHAIKNIKKLPAPLFTKVLFFAMRGMMKKNDWNPTDKKHWQDNGWLNGKKPF